MAAKHLIITGANGFLGRYTIKQAVSHGWNVSGIVRREDAVNIVRNAGGTAIFLKSLKSDILTPIFADADAVIHFAGIVTGSEQEFDEINIAGTRNVAYAASKAEVARLILLSGLGVHLYGKVDWATNVYFQAKHKIEALISEYSVPWIIFRPSYILGPGDELIPQLIQDLIYGLVRVVGSGEYPMQPIFIEDATTAFLQAAAGIGSDNFIYNLVGPEIITMNKLLHLVRILLLKYRSLPELRVEYIPIEQAATILELPKEIIDIFRCDVIADPQETERKLKIPLTPLTVAIEKIIQTEVNQ